MWARSRLTVVSPSRWMAELATNSILGRFEVRVIPHGIDTAEFAPRPREACRAALGIPDGRTALLFTAASLASRSVAPAAPGAGGDAADRKGVELLLAALRAVPPELRSRCSLVLMGGEGQVMGEALLVSRWNPDDGRQEAEAAARADAGRNLS